MLYENVCDLCNTDRGYKEMSFYVGESNHSLYERGEEQQTILAKGGADNHMLGKELYSTQKLSTELQKDKKCPVSLKCTEFLCSYLPIMT